MKKIIRYKKELFRIAINAPKSLVNFCIYFQNTDDDLLKVFKLQTKVDLELKNFLIKNELTWRNKLFYENFDFNIFFQFLFVPDKIYEENAINISEYTGFFCLKNLYLVINYINDNFPVIKKRELKDDETEIIKFLLFSGKKPKIDNKIIKRICNNYKCNNLNTALNLILIEKYLRKDNLKFIKTVNKIIDELSK